VLAGGSHLRSEKQALRVVKLSAQTIPARPAGVSRSRIAASTR